MKQDILNLVNELDEVSFVELTAQIPSFFGDNEMSLRENTILWSSISIEAGNAINELLESGSIQMIVTDFMTYLIDGNYPRLPVAQQVNRKYKSPHWLPVVLCKGAGSYE